MTDPDVQAALAQIDARWDERRARTGLERAQRTLQRRRTRRSVLAGASVLAAVGLVVLAAQRRQPLTAAPETLALADGSQIVLLDAHSRVLVTEDTPHATRITLERGHARFEVVPRRQRVFCVQSGGVRVQVLGTIFELERAAERTRVSVLRGRVAVDFAEGRRELTPRQAEWFSPATAPLTAAASGGAAQPLTGSETRPQAASANTPSVESVAAATPPPGAAQLHAPLPPSADASLDGRARQQGARSAHVGHASSGASTARGEIAQEPSAAAGGWRESAARGEHARAYALLQQPGAEPASVDELLLAADAARLSGHPEAALPFLERVVREHARDARASLAAFTLGGVLMQQLGRPREAQVAYAEARALALHASLAQDALARQVEAAQRAGDAAQARELAREYLTRYPDGRRVQAVRRFAGLGAE